MSETPPFPGLSAEFRWQAFFQQTDEPLFLLDRHRRLRFVNRAWEALTGFAASDVRGIVCPRRRPANGERLEQLAYLLCPPAEALTGQFSRSGRRGPAAGNRPQWWVLEYLPLQKQERLIGIIGRIRVETLPPSALGATLPAELSTLRDPFIRRYMPDQIPAALPTMQRVLTQARLAAELDCPVLLLGEAGTGKEWIARTIHHEAADRHRPFMAIACAHLPSVFLAGLLSDEGPFAETAMTRFLYLKEPQALSRDLQARVLLLAADPQIRLVAGCSVDLIAEVRAGRLLEDLYCALSTLPIVLPPLRERRADLPALVERLLKWLPERAGQKPTTLSPAAWDLLLNHSWPGNLDELRRVLRAAAQRAGLTPIEASHLPTSIRQAAARESNSAPRPARLFPLDSLLEEVERRLIQLALRQTRGNKSQAAERLSIWRARLLRRMEALGISDRPEALERGDPEPDPPTTEPSE